MNVPMFIISSWFVYQKLAHVDLAGVNTEVNEAERALLDTAIKFERKKIEELKVGYPGCQSALFLCLHCVLPLTLACSKASRI